MLGDLERALAGAWMRDSAWHGEGHWRCVAATGLSLADELPGCERALVFWFGLLHDTRRESEHRDPGHGPRGAAYARALAEAGLLRLDGKRLALLCQAIELHADGLTSADPTIGACWDADRLHLPRVGIEPDPDLLSTPLAREQGRLAEAARVRAAPPTWAELAALV